MHNNPDNPRVCVVVPILNEVKFLRESMDSLLAQDYQPLEVVVYDGGSTDGSLEILKAYPVEVIVEPGLGQMAAINRGWRNTAAEFVTWWAGDDVYYPGAISRLVAELQTHPEVGWVHGDIDVIDEKGIVTGYVTSGEIQFPGLVDFTLNMTVQSTLFRRTAVERAGMLDEQLRLAADWDLYLRLAQYYSAHYVPFKAAMRRMHAGSEDAQNFEKMLKVTATMMERFFERPDLSKEQRKLRRRAVACSRLNLAAFYSAKRKRFEAIQLLTKAAVASPVTLLTTRQGLSAMLRLVIPKPIKTC